MQLYAIDEDTRVLAKAADRRKNYLCPECQTILRVRSGLQRQPHFFHLRSPSSCRLHQKSLLHLDIQSEIARRLGLSAVMEYRFKEINRIADVAWVDKKIIFEVQCSPISLKEVYLRFKDYESLGWKLVWILSSRRYNHRRLTAAEYFLRKEKTTYYVVRNHKSDIFIYDQFEILKQGRRIKKSYPLKVNIDKPDFSTSPLTFKGDFSWRLSNGKLSKEFLEWIKQPLTIPKHISFFEKIKNMYLFFLYHLLSKAAFKSEEVDYNDQRKNSPKESF